MKSFSNLTVGEYQALYKIHKSEGSEIDKSVDSIAILTGKPRWEVEDMNMDDFKQKAKEISILFSSLSEKKPSRYLKVNGKRYKVCLNPRKITAGQYIDIQSFLDQRANVENLHKLMACLLLPVKGIFRKVGKYDGENHEQISDGIQNCNFIDVHSTCGFFLRLWNYSIKAMAPYLKREMIRMRKENLMSEEVLLELMDGFTMHEQ